MRKENSFVSLFILLILSSVACQLSAVSVQQDIITPSPTMRAVRISDVIILPQVQSCEVTAREFLNVRGGPSVSWSVIRQLAHAERVRVTDWSNGWGMVAADEWVNGSFLKC